ncbi:hypothetical protein J2787_002620 [Chryseobacterium rhizosphaerae]|uniref:Uncharacterized protein n=1 Tax=Chryseobacterium rhizosphaerae TaxID=395937 RepID=A0AAE3YBS1_9FLAO|nr:hypothetical protein [Chryseobacterium rhizosphaerae]
MKIIDNINQSNLYHMKVIISIMAKLPIEALTKEC